MRKLLLAVLLGISARVLADDGFYSVTGLGEAEVDIKYKLPDALRNYGLYTTKKEESLTRTFGLGYKVTDWLQVEGAYNNLGTYSACIKHTAVGNLVCGNASVESYSLGALAFAGPFYARLDYHKATGNLYYLNAHKVYSEDAVTAGVGVRTSLTERISVRYELREPTVPKWNVSLEFRF